MRRIVAAAILSVAAASPSSADILAGAGAAYLARIRAMGESMSAAMVADQCELRSPAWFHQFEATVFHRMTALARATWPADPSSRAQYRMEAVNILTASAAAASSGTTRADCATLKASPAFLRQLDALAAQTPTTQP